MSLQRILTLPNVGKKNRLVLVNTVLYCDLFNVYTIFYGGRSIRVFFSWLKPFVFIDRVSSYVLQKMFHFYLLNRSRSVACCTVSNILGVGKDVRLLSICWLFRATKRFSCFCDILHALSNCILVLLFLSLILCFLWPVLGRSLSFSLHHHIFAASGFFDPVRLSSLMMKVNSGFLLSTSRSIWNWSYMKVNHTPALTYCHLNTTGSVVLIFGQQREFTHQEVTHSTLRHFAVYVWGLYLTCLSVKMNCVLTQVSLTRRWLIAFTQKAICNFALHTQWVHSIHIMSISNRWIL